MTGFLFILLEGLRVCALLSVAWALTPFLRRPSILAFLTPFILQLCVGQLVLFVLACCLETWETAAFLSIGIGISGWHLMPFLPYRRERNDPEAFKILHANILFSLNDLSRLKAWIDREQPDLIALVEANSACADLLSVLRPFYPFQHFRPRDDCGRGLALLSRIAFNRLEERDLILPDSPFLHAVLKVHNRLLDIVLLHAENPTRDLKIRDQEFARLATENLRPPGSAGLILIGDLNATPYCKGLKDLAQAQSLRQTRQGRGWLGTFPAQAPHSLFRLPIDHIFVSSEIDVLSLTCGPLMGSDHLPLLLKCKA